MTLQSDMLRVLEDTDDTSLKDVTLIGSDGGRVEASKAVLAIRSGVFRRMFFGRFQEVEAKEVEMDYSAVVLQVVVKYCFVDELDLDLLVPEEESDRTTDAEAVAMIQVRDAANYLELKELHVSLSNELGESILSEDPRDLACVCAIMQEMMVRGGTDGALWATCMDLVEMDPEACFLPETDNQGILACSVALLTKLFQSTTKLNPFVTVQALKKWHQHKGSVEEDQLTELQKLAGAIQLELISPPKLAEIQPCDLFPMERLYKACVHSMKAPFVAPPTTPTPAAPGLFDFGATPQTATVRGAGVECANGVYEWKGGGFGAQRGGGFGAQRGGGFGAQRGGGFGAQKGVHYQLAGTYGDMPSVYQLVQEGQSGWKLLVNTGKRISGPFGGPAYENKLTLYEATGRASKHEIPPFALWQCVDGKDPTPYVTCQGKHPNTGSAATFESSSS